MEQAPETQPQELITGVPTAKELAARARETEIQRSMEEDAFTREALVAMGKGAVGTAAELNLLYPSQTERAPLNLPPKPEGPIPEPFVDDDMVSGEELKNLREQLRQEGKL